MRVGWEGRRRGWTDVDSMDTSLVTPTHSFTLPAFVLVFSLPFPYPRVCEIGVVVAVVCLIRSVLLIGGYYTYSNLFCLVSRVLFHPVCHAVCAPSLGSSKSPRRHPLTSTRDFAPSYFVFLWFVCVIIRAFLFDSALFFHSLIDRISPSVALHPHHTYLV